MGRAKSGSISSEYDSLITKEVYNRCVWAVRDMDRMRSIVEAGAGARIAAPHESASIYDLPEGENAALISETAIARAGEELACIERALVAVPDVYRKGVLANIRDKEPFSELAHFNTWKKWKQTFIYELARGMHLI